MKEILYFLFILGLILINYNNMFYLFNSIKNRILLRHDFKNISKIEQIHNYSGTLREIEKLLIATGLNKAFKKPTDLILISASLCLCSFVICFLINGIKMGIIVSLIMFSLPIVVVYIKLNNKRVYSSKEGDILIQELLANYKVYSFNMKEAIEITCKGLENAPNSRGILIQLFNGLNKSFDKTEVENALDVFKYTLGTAWASALASDIYFAEVHGIKVTNSLEDLAKSINKSKEVIENSRREHNEARLILKYLAPISYILSVVCACRFFGFNLTKFVEYQFMTPLGLQWFIIMILIYGISILINSWLANERMDI